MARARNIKPGFFKNEDLAEMDPLSRLLFAGLWCLADREGRLEDRPKRIKAELFPYDNCDVDQLLDDLQEYGFIHRYEVDGGKYIFIQNWHKHQNPHHMEVPSVIPPAPGTTDKYAHSPVTKVQRQRIFDRDGKKCVECGVTKNLSIDHIIPVSKGGDSSDSNLRTLCKACNSKKGNRDVESTSNQERVVNDPLTNRDQLDKTASCPTDSLIPDSLNLIPDSLIPLPPTTDSREQPKKEAVVVGGRDLYVFKSVIDQYKHYFVRDPNETIKNLLHSYLDDEVQMDMLAWAMRDAAEKGKDWNYAKGTLNNLFSRGIRTAEQAELADQEYKQSRVQKRGSNVVQLVDKLPASVQRQQELQQAGTFASGETRKIADDPELSEMLERLRSSKIAGN